MPLFHDEDQAMLAETASGFMADEGNIAKQMRHYRDRNCPDGFGHALWEQMAELGFTGILVSEEDGGLGMGNVEAAATALGKGSADMRERYLPGLVSGKAVYAVAVDETAKHNPQRIAMRAEKSGNGFKLSGKKSFVIQAVAADMIVVAARTSGDENDDEGVTMFAVPKDAAGLSQDPVRLVDSSMASHLTLDGVELDGDAVIGEVDGGREVLDAMLRAGRVGTAAEGVGVARGAMDMTVDYLKQRKQFGKHIGLQHRAAHLYSEVEIARAATIKAAQLLDAGAPSADLMVSVAKAKVAKAGGIGMTDEYDIGLYMKRDRALQEFLGDAYFHANRVAEMSGY